MLKSIVIVTISVLNLASVEDAYQDHPGYSAVERGALSTAVAGVWAAQNMAGRRYLVMQPASKEPVYLRFIENPATAGHAAMTANGWNATELLVRDPDALRSGLISVHCLTFNNKIRHHCRP